MTTAQETQASLGYMHFLIWHWPAGLRLIRTTDVHHIKKGTYKFQLPKTGFANQWTTSALIGICSEFDKAAWPARWQEEPIPPRSRVRRQDSGRSTRRTPRQYRIQSLENGIKQWVGKEPGGGPHLGRQLPPPKPGTCPAADQNGTRAPEEHLAPGQRPPSTEYAPLPRLPELTSNPLGNWASTTHSAIMALRLDIERELARIRPKQDQLRELERVYTLVTGNHVAGESPADDTRVQAHGAAAAPTALPRGYPVASAQRGRASRKTSWSALHRQRQVPRLRLPQRS